MCGICGFTGTPQDETLDRMCQSIVHRGPDEAGFFRSEVINLAMRRLAIVDLETGQQPVFNEDRQICAVFNGELYDFRVHRARLEEQGHRFQSNHSDSEVIVHLYEEYGEDWATRVNGMFAVALWDARSDRLLLYRDRIGKKPLYYARHSGRLLFASEIKAILTFPGMSREPDHGALYSYFGLKNTSAPRTAFAGIRQLMPGQFLRYENGQAQTQQYWRVDLSQADRNVTAEEASGRLLELLDDAVRLRMDCDAPYGAYLSGGVDSSSVAAMMRRYCKQELKTFCLGYDEPPTGQFQGKQRDIDFARLMSQRLQTTHYEHILSPGNFAEGMPGVIRAFDEPFSGTCSTYFLTPLIRSQVKVALSGDGADELFGSYLTHRLAFPLSYARGLLAQGRGEWDALEEIERNRLKPFDSDEGFTYLLSLASAEGYGWRDQLCVFSHDQRRRLLRPEILEAAGNPQRDAPYQSIEESLGAADPLNCALEWDQRELLPNQVLPFVDRLSMAFSVEVRSPYLDYRIIEYANRLPGELKIRNGINKFVHKQAMATLLPEDLLARPKEGFVQPNYTWMHGPLKKWAMDCLCELPGTWFHREYIDELTGEFLGGSQEHNARIWNLICFSLWFRQYQN